MITLQATKREKEELVQTLRSKGIVPAVMYGPERESLMLSVDGKTFDHVFGEAGETTLVELNWDKEKAPVFVIDVQRDPLSNRPMHVDFYQPILNKPIEVDIPLIFEGEAPAVKDLGGTFIRNMNEVTVRALPQDIPHEITVDISGLATFDDIITIGDLKLGERVQIAQDQDPEEVIAQVMPAEDVEAELAVPVEEKVDEVQKSEEKGKKEEEGEEEEK